MKKILLLTALTGMQILIFAQNVQLRTNGFSVNLKPIDTLFYSEFSITSSVKENAKKNDFNLTPLKYSIGTISRSKITARQETPTYTTKFYVYEDGTLQAPTSQLFLKPTNIDAFRKKYKDIGILEGHPHLEGFYFLYVTNKNYLTGEGMLFLCNKIYSEKAVSIIEPVYVKLLKTENPFRPWEWNIRNTGIVPGGIVGADMGVENAWNLATGAGIRVAVIDDGVDLTHPDLQGNLLPGFDATGNNSGGAPAANNGHGTNCAGIIASVDNTIGTIGVAFNSNIIPLRMGIVSGGLFNTNDTWITNCFTEAVNRGADVISNSWGGGSPSAQINTAIQNAVNNGRNGRGCVVLFAAGNNNTTVNYPATNVNVIAVGASTPCDTRKRSSNDPAQVNPNVNTDPEGTSCDGEAWWGSNFGTNLDVLAPGVWISTTDNVGVNGFVAGDYNDHFNGTSAACPNTAAVVALILSANPNLTGQQARDILEQTCFKIPNGNFQPNVAGQPNGTWSNQAGYGRVNADLAVCRARVLLSTISGPSQFCTSGTYSIPNLPAGATVQWNVTSIYGIQSQSVSNNVLTLNRVSDGSAIITATVNACGNTIQVPSRTVQVGGTVITVSSTQTGCEWVQFNVSGGASGASYNWSSNANTILFNGTSTTATTATGQIDAVITGYDIPIVTTTNTCGQAVSVGGYYNPYDRQIQGLYPEYTSGDHVSVSVNTTPYDTYYRWYINNILVKEGSDAYYYCTCYYETPDARVCGDNTIRVEVETSCGIPSSFDAGFYRICGYFRTQSNVELFPNPARDQVTVKLKQINAKQTMGQLKDIREVRILNKVGSVKRIVKYPANTNTISVNISNLPLDIYYVEVTDGRNSARLPLSIVK